MKLQHDKTFSGTSQIRHLKSFREDFTEELNETSISPGLKNINTGDKVKFFNKNSKTLALSKSAVFSKPRYHTPTPSFRSKQNNQQPQKYSFGPSLNPSGVKPLASEEDSPTRRNLSKEFSYSFAQNNKKPFPEKVPSKCDTDAQSPTNLETPKRPGGFFEEAIPKGSNTLHLLKNTSGYFDSKQKNIKVLPGSTSPLVRNYSASFTVASQKKFEDPTQKKSSRGASKQRIN